MRVEAKRLIFRQALIPDRITRGETARLTAGVSGRIVLPVVVRMAVYWPPTFVRTPQWFHMTLLPGRQPPWLDQSFASPHRGLWRWGVDRARVLDLFGLFSLPVRPEIPVAGPPTFTVYPRIYELDIQPAVSAMYLEDAPVQSLVRDYGDSFAGTRLYQHGDSFKRIHWKQTIRTREMHTRQYELSTEQFTMFPVFPAFSPFFSVLCPICPPPSSSASAFGFFVCPCLSLFAPSFLSGFALAACASCSA